MVKSEIYLFMSAFEHNGEGTVANQVLPAELKPPDGLHGSLVNCCCCFFKLVQDEGFPNEAHAVRLPCRGRPPCYWREVASSQLVGIVAENINIDKDMSKFF